MRSSVGPGVGVGRCVSSRGVPLVREMRAGWWPAGMEGEVEVVLEILSLISLTREDMMGWLIGCLWWDVIDWI